ncbi:hypothetical protein H7169_03575 [Candidatus Gracilibacteria bacterium]|nr:hypothetical protein [Candidatus Gracilibacteria bacterium]
MQLSLVNHLDRRGISLIEIMAMIAVLGLAIASMFSTVIGGIYFARDSENRIKAINLAREGLEGVTNLRNTNWLRFSSDQTNCWKIENYQSTCIGAPLFAAANSLGDSPITKKYILINSNGAWYLSGSTATTGSGLWVDNNGFYLATGALAPGDPLCTISKSTNCRSPFTREIRILKGITNNTISVTSVVDWYEKRPQNVTLTTTLTNWKSKFY